jgi:hypothetical protein
MTGWLDFWLFRWQPVWRVVVTSMRVRPQAGPTLMSSPDAMLF